LVGDQRRRSIPKKGIDSHASWNQFHGQCKGVEIDPLRLESIP